MISFFRRFLASRWVLLLFGLVLVAFLITGVNTRLSGLGGGGAAPTGDAVATVGRQRIDADDLFQRAQTTLASIKQQKPAADMAGFVAANGVERLLNVMIDDAAIAQFGGNAGIAVSKRLVDAQISSIPAFHRPDGSFDESLYRQTLAARRLSDAQVRAELASDLVHKQVLTPVSGAAREPAGVAIPFAALLVENRTGSWGLVPSAAMPAGPPAPDAAVAAYYKAHQARYALPERRSIRYALFGRDQVAAAAQPTDAELKAVYDKAGQLYAAKAERTLSQVVFTGPDAQAKAAALAAKVKNGTPFATAAAADLIKVGEKTQAEFSDFASPAAAAAAFAAPVGGTTAPTQSPFGWNVVHVDSARTIPAKSFQSVRGELAAAIGKQKGDAALGKLIATLQDQLADNATFDDVVRKNGLTAVQTPPLLPNGVAPGQPGYKAPREIAPLLKAAAQAEPGDQPTVEPIQPGERYAVLAVADVVPAAVQPLAQVAATVRADMAAEAGAQRARAIAQAILAKVNAGTPMAQAFAGAGVPLPPVQQGGGRRAQIKPDAPAPLRMLFAMVPGRAKLLPAPGNGGWYVVRLDSVQPADPRRVPGLVDQTRSELGQLLGEEYAEQFALAARARLKPQESAAAIAAVKARLLGQPQ